MTMIYGLCDPTTNELRYVGKTTDRVKRMSAHRQEARRGVKNHRCAWMRSLSSEPIMVELLAVPEEQASSVEKHVIALCRVQGVRLVNMTDGGDGQSRGYVASAETRAKIGAAHRGRKQPPSVIAALASRVVTPETRAKLSAAHKGQKHSLEALEKMRIASTGRKQSRESIEKTAAANRGRKRSPEHTAALLASRLGTKHSAESIERMRQVKRGKKASPETRAKMSVSSRLGWAKRRVAA